MAAGRRGAELPVPAPRQVVVDPAHLAVLVDPARRLLAQSPVLAVLVALPVVPADPPVKPQVPVEEVSVHLRRRSRSAAMAGR